MPNPARTRAMIENDDHVFSGSIKRTGTFHAPDFISPTAAVTLSASEHGGKVVKCNSLCRKLTLPLATALLAGVEFTVVAAAVVASAAAELWVDPQSGDTINGGTTGIGLRLQNSLDALGDHLTVKCDGAAWWTTQRFGSWVASSV